MRTHSFGVPHPPCMPCRLSIPAKCRFINNLSIMPKGGDMESVREKETVHDSYITPESSSITFKAF
ncbi:hypothetical protein PO909_024450 [Leuciscus waleckii]